MHDLGCTVSPPGPHRLTSNAQPRAEFINDHCVHTYCSGGTRRTFAAAARACIQGAHENSSSLEPASEKAAISVGIARQLARLETRARRRSCGNEIGSFLEFALSWGAARYQVTSHPRFEDPVHAQRHWAAGSNEAYGGEGRGWGNRGDCANVLPPPSTTH